MSSSDKPTTGEKAGSCHCGAVEVWIEGAPLCSHLCHCTACQQLSGAPFAMYVDFKAAQVHLHDPTGAVRLYVQQPPRPQPDDGNDTTPDQAGGAGGAMLGRATCAVCRATLQCRNPNLAAMTAVPAGVLACEVNDSETDPRAVRYRALVPPPSVEFWCRRRHGWLAPAPGARLTYREQPVGGAELRECMEVFGLV